MESKTTLKVCMTEFFFVVEWIMLVGIEPSRWLCGVAGWHGCVGRLGVLVDMASVGLLLRTG